MRVFGTMALGGLESTDQLKPYHDWWNAFSTNGTKHVQADTHLEGKQQDHWG
jgi:hypothetical protein